MHRLSSPRRCLSLGFAALCSLVVVSISSADVPPPIIGASAIYDPIDDRLIVFGGNNLNDVWQVALPSGVWTQLNPAGPPPSRQKHTAVYDPVRHRMIVFGGVGTGNVSYNDVWALSMTGTPTWTQIHPTTSAGSPPIRDGHAAAYDPIGDQMIIFGGLGRPFSLLSDAWALPLSGTPEWLPLSPMNAPEGRYGHGGAYDATRSRFLSFGGNVEPDPAFTSQTLLLEMDGSPAWTQVNSGASPHARSLAGFVFDDVGDRALMFGGYYYCYWNCGPLIRYNDTWSLSASGEWSQIFPGGPPPSPRHMAAVAIDAVNRRMFVFGGNEAAGASNELWVLSLGAEPSWSQLIPSTAGVEAQASNLQLAVSPNPARNTVMIDYAMSQAGTARVSVRDVQGRVIARLQDGWKEPGAHRVSWDGPRSQATRPGIYFARIETSAGTVSRRFVVTK